MRSDFFFVVLPFSGVTCYFLFILFVCLIFVFFVPFSLNPRPLVQSFFKCMRPDSHTQLAINIRVSRSYYYQSRALSLRNLISGYECGRVFPAGVGPGSPSRDAVNWLPSRFSLSVETRRRFGWLRMMVFPGAHLFRAPIWCPSGGWRHARGREHCRGEPGSSLSGGYAPDSAKAEGSSIVDEPGEG